MSKQNSITVGGEVFDPGTNGMVKINIGRLPTGTLIDMPVYVFNGKRKGPVLLIQAGLHGDEINGVEILRRMIYEKRFQISAGTVLVVPTVNVYGFIHFSRDMPDGKDINRSFPGSKNGSLASRVARSVNKELLPLADMAIDLHTGGAQRHNYAQIRYTEADPQSKALAEVFGAPFYFASTLIPRSFRKTAHAQNIATIVFEGGESMRFDEKVIQWGMAGIERVMHAYGLKTEATPAERKSVALSERKWLRAPMAGMFLPHIANGAFVKKDAVMGMVTDTNSKRIKKIKAPFDGYLICLNHQAVVNQGDALFHLGKPH